MQDVIYATMISNVPGVMISDACIGWLSQAQTGALHWVAASIVFVLGLGIGRAIGYRAGVDDTLVYDGSLMLSADDCAARDRAE